MRTAKLTTQQLEWANWAIEAMDVYAGLGYPEELAEALDCPVDYAEALLKAQEQCRIIDGVVELPEPSEAADECVSDLGYRLVTQAPDVVEGHTGMSAGDRAQIRAAANAWEKIRDAYAAAGGRIIDQIVYCLGE